VEASPQARVWVSGELGRTLVGAIWVSTVGTGKGTVEIFWVKANSSVIHDFWGSFSFSYKKTIKRD
jgi:hypothetical protein